jgi:hypothetical protein
MLPWVLLYGFTGWFFNHPGILTGDQVSTFSVSDFPEASLSQIPSAATTAQAVADAINKRAIDEQKTVTLSDVHDAQFRDSFKFTVTCDEATHVVSINPTNGSGHVRTTFIPVQETAKRTRVENPMNGIANVRIGDDTLRAVRNEVSGIVESLLLPAGNSIKQRGQARIEFAAVANEVPVVVTYNLASGKIESVVDSDRRVLGTKTFLEKLHLSRGYSPGVGTRWVWALLVDVMVVSMVFWGISGLFMWWQVKRTRKIGLCVLLVSAVFAALMMVNMHDQLTRKNAVGKPNKVAVKGQ